MRQCEGKAGKRNNRGEGPRIYIATNKFKHTAVADIKPEDADDTDRWRSLSENNPPTYWTCVNGVNDLPDHRHRPDSFKSYT